MIKGFSLDIYDSDVSFALNTNEKELNAFFDQVEAPKEYREMFWEEYNQNKIGALTTGYSATNMLVVFRDEPNNKVVAHELFHVAYNILKHRGIEDEEAWAYLIGYLTEMFYDLFLDNVEQEEISQES